MGEGNGWPPAALRGPSRGGNARALHPNSHYRADGEAVVRMVASFLILTATVAIFTHGAATRTRMQRNAGW